MNYIFAEGNCGDSLRKWKRRPLTYYLCNQSLDDDLYSPTIYLSLNFIFSEANFFLFVIVNVINS